MNQDHHDTLNSSKLSTFASDEGPTCIARYMTFSSLVSVLQTGKLWFSRIDLFDDFYEGVPYVSSARTGEGGLKEKGGNGMAGAYHRDIYCNCWTDSDAGESASLYSVFARADDAVAIRSTRDFLNVGQQEGLHVESRRVTYSDEDIGHHPVEQWRRCCYRKTLSYESEKEFRYLIQFTNAANAAHREKFNINAADGRPNPDGIDVSINPAAIVEIIVGPRTAAWYLRTVTEFCDRVGLQARVRRSDIRHRALTCLS